MTDKEVRELRRRFAPEKTHISTVHGCYVNESKNIVSTFSESLSMLAADEAERFLLLLKKSLSGSVGRSLVDVEFSTKDVLEGEEHKLLSLLRNSELNDESVRNIFYQRVIDSLSFDGAYLILLAYDVYPVPYRGSDEISEAEFSDEEFRYFVCSICPVKAADAQLSYQFNENRFHITSAGYIVTMPELGFLFPAFDNRGTNLYGALYYSRSAKENHPEFAEGIFHSEMPMPAAAQKETFDLLLSEALKEECSLSVLQSVNEQVCEWVELHKESKVAEPLLLSGEQFCAALTGSGVTKERAEEFAAAFDAHFGENAAVAPQNVLDQKKFVVKTEEATIKLPMEHSEQIETRVIDGVKYLLIPAGKDVTVNGVSICVENEEDVEGASEKSVSEKIASEEEN